MRPGAIHPALNLDAWSAISNDVGHDAHTVLHFFLEILSDEPYTINHITRYDAKSSAPGEAREATWGSAVAWRGSELTLEKAQLVQYGSRVRYHYSCTRDKVRMLIKASG